MSELASVTLIRRRIADASADAFGMVRILGYGLLGLQLAAFLAWSTVMFRHFALTTDFVVYDHAWYEITHGNLNPSLPGFHSGVPVWRDHCEFLLWPLAPLYWLGPHGVALLWVQDLCLAGAEMAAFGWLCEIVQRRAAGRTAVWLASTGLVLLAANPWLWWAVSFDFHVQLVATLFAVLLARDLAQGRRRAWVWVIPLMACGDVADTYLAGVGLGCALTNRRCRLAGAGLTVLGIAAVAAITLVHGNVGSGVQSSYGYLTGRHGTSAPGLPALAAGVLTHPAPLLRMLWEKRIDLWANLAPGGLLGLAYLPLAPLVAVVTLANQLHPGLMFSEPLFQSAPVYVLLPVGTVAVLGSLARWRRPLGLLAAGLLAAQAVGWAAAWAPRTQDQWLRVPNATAATLEKVSSHIPASAEVVASQGVVGRFADRANFWRLNEPGPVWIGGRTAWFVITPMAGVETQTTASAMGFIGELAGPMHASLVTDADGVWAFRWRVPAGTHVVTVPDESGYLPAWAAPITPGQAGRRVLSGAVTTWHMTSTGGQGYVADGMAWQRQPGRYEASVRLSASGPVNIEVWNDTGHLLLSRRTAPKTTGIRSISLPVNAAKNYQGPVYAGWGPFQARFVPAFPGMRLELRVWSPGGEKVNVYGADLSVSKIKPRAVDPRA